MQPLCCINLDLNPTLILPLLIFDFLFRISFICAALKELFFHFPFPMCFSGNDSKVDGLVNFEKLRMIAKEIRHVGRMASVNMDPALMFRTR